MNDALNIGTNECGCELSTCYACRRYEIDVTALKIYHREMRIVTGMPNVNAVDHSYSQALQYRNRKVNELAVEFAARR